METRFHAFISPTGDGTKRLRSFTTLHPSSGNGDDAITLSPFNQLALNVQTPRDGTQVENEWRSF